MSEIVQTAHGQTLRRNPMSMHHEGTESLGAKANGAEPVDPFEQFCELSLSLDACGFTCFFEQASMLPQSGHDGGHQGNFHIVVALMLPGAEMNAHILFVFLEALLRHPHDT